MTAPFPTLALPELVSVSCPFCAGDGYHVTGDGYTEVACTKCASTGRVEVCGGCMTAPDAASDICLCNLPPVLRFGVEAGWISFEEAA